MSYSSLSPVQTGGVRSAETPSPPDILTYCYGSRMVYVTTAETYDQAIDFAQDEFPELKDVERGRIRLAVRVWLSGSGSNAPECRQSAEIGRSAWSAVTPTLARFEIVEIQLAESPAAPSGLRSSASVAEPPPYETGAASDMKAFATATNLFGSGSQVPGSQSQSHLQPQSFTNRLARLFSRSS